MKLTVKKLKNGTEQKRKYDKNENIIYQSDLRKDNSLHEMWFEFDEKNRETNFRTSMGSQIETRYDEDDFVYYKKITDPSDGITEIFCEFDENKRLVRTVTIINGKLC